MGIDTGLVVVGELGEGADDTPLALGTPPTWRRACKAGSAADRSTQCRHLPAGAGVVCLSGIGDTVASGLCTARDDLSGAGRQRCAESSEVASARANAAGRAGAGSGLLLERWAQVKDGQGQVVVLSGEAGIGKSRLVQVVKEHIAGEPHVLGVPRFTLSSAQRHVSGHRPVAAGTAGAARRYSARKLRKLEEALAAYGVSLPKVVPLLASLLSVLLRDNNLSPEEHKQQTIEALVTLLLTLAARQPVLIIVEDLHWVDPSTLELLSLLIDQVPAARLVSCSPVVQNFVPHGGCTSI